MRLRANAVHWGAKQETVLRRDIRRYGLCPDAIALLPQTHGPLRSRRTRKLNSKSSIAGSSAILGKTPTAVRAVEGLVTDLRLTGGSNIGYRLRRLTLTDLGVYAPAQLLKRNVLKQPLVDVLRYDLGVLV